MPKPNRVRSDVYFDPLLEELLLSIPSDELEGVYSEVDSSLVSSKIDFIVNRLSIDQTISLKLSESRITALALLQGVLSNKVSIAQLASFHVLDSAIRTLCTDTLSYYIDRITNAQGEVENKFFYTPVLKKSKGKLGRYFYGSDRSFTAEEVISPLASRVHRPLLQRFFNFTALEWENFCTEMARAPVSEQFYYTLNAPEEGCWSSIIAKIQKVLNCMKVLDKYTPTNYGWMLEKVMLVPSFTMFQAALNAKAASLGRSSVQLIPTYGYMDPIRYADLKSQGKFAFTLYLPEADLERRYQLETGRFRTSIDGHPKETAFGGAIHDVYHALREMAMSENVAKARMRLATIARGHPKNKQCKDSPAVDDILVDGELVFSYPAEMDTMFNPKFRPKQAESFGQLFYLAAVKPWLHDDLKRAFIEDMVLNAQLWHSEYNLGQLDLVPEDQRLYDEIAAEYAPPLRLPENFSFTRAMTKVGLFTGNEVSQGSDRCFTHSCNLL